MKYSREDLVKMYYDLPDEMQDKLSSEKIVNDIRDIASKNELTEEKESVLSEYISYTMIGILPQDKFTATIQKVLEIDKSVAENIYKEVNESIFSSISKDSENIISPKKNEEVVEENNNKESGDPYQEEL